MYPEISNFIFYFLQVSTSCIFLFSNVGKNIKLLLDRSHRDTNLEVVLTFFKD